MTANLERSPKNWLSLKLCEGIFNTFKDKIVFNQPIPPFNSRPSSFLEGILGSVKQSFEGEYLNKTILDASVAYFLQLNLGHAFVNGNKRMSVLFTHFFLLMNGFDFDLSNYELYIVALQVAILRERNYSREKITRAIRNLFKDHIVDLKLPKK